MRKLKLQVQISIDGFIAGPSGEMDWMTLPWSDDLNLYVTDLLQDTDCILLGRKLAEGFIPYWAGVAGDPENPERASGKQFTDMAKVVFSKTIADTDPKVLNWNNTSIENTDLRAAVAEIKKMDGGDLIAYGGAGFVSSLINENLIDELYLFINPTALGSGMPIFKGITEKKAYRMADTKTFDCGIAVMKYTPV